MGGIESGGILSVGSRSRLKTTKVLGTRTVTLGYTDGMELSTQLQRLTDRVADLSERISKLESASSSSPLRLAIASFAPGPYSLLRPVEVLVEQVDDAFVASFFDANVSASGDNQQEAFDNLKSLILDVYDSLLTESPERLGPELKRQLAVLEAFLRKD